MWIIMLEQFGKVWYFWSISSSLWLPESMLITINQIWPRYSPFTDTFQPNRGWEFHNCKFKSDKPTQSLSYKNSSVNRQIVENVEKHNWLGLFTVFRWPEEGLIKTQKASCRQMDCAEVFLTVIPSPELLTSYVTICDRSGWRKCW